MKILLFVFLFFLFSRFIPGAAAQDATVTDANTVMGTASGQVSNGTSASSVPAGLAVQLLVYQDTVNVETRETIIQPDGSFTFADVPISDARDYVAIVTYRDRKFLSAITKGDPAAAAVDLPVSIYELTEDPAVITLQSINTRVTPVELEQMGSGLEIVQVFVFANLSDRAYTTANALDDGYFVSLVIPLPPGSIVLTLDNPERYIVAQQDFALVDTLPVRPGANHVVTVTYFLPYDDAAIIEQQVDYTLDGSVKLLLWPETLALTSEQVFLSGQESLEGRPYRVFTGNLALAAGDVLRYQLEGSRSSGLSTGQIDGLTVLIIVIVVGILGIGVLAIVLQRQRPTPQQMIEPLTRQIAALEAQHNTGQINHDLYHQRRKALQDELDKLLGAK